MRISERNVKTQAAGIVTVFRHHYFAFAESSDAIDIAQEFWLAKTKLDAILELFPDGKIYRFLLNCQSELYGLGRLCGSPWKDAGLSAGQEVTHG